jgi:P27 family predicted phage terminase small subunit
VGRTAESEEYHRVVGTRATRAKDEVSPHVSGRPTRPSYFTEVGRKEWNRIIKILTERGTLTKGDGPVIELYVLTYCDWRAFNDDVEAQGRVVDSVWTDDKGTHSSRAPNPILKNVAQTANALRALLIQLGVTPTARERAKQTRLNPKKELVHGSLAWLKEQKRLEESGDFQEEVHV